MSPALRQCYFAVADALPPALIDAAAAGVLAEISGRVPNHADAFGFEVRLADEPRADFGIALSPPAGVNAFLIPRDACALDERWERIRAFIQCWTEPESPLAARVPFLFLEFDADGPRNPFPVPSVFLALDWPIEELARTARRGGSMEHESSPGWDVASRIVGALRRQPLEPAVRALLARCFALVPNGGVVLHLAVMLSRIGEGVRLSVLVPRGEVRTYLGELGWQGGLDQLERTLHAFAPFTDFDAAQASIQIDLDVGVTLGRAAGLMLRPPDECGWPALLDAFVQAGLCLPRKRDALLAWPGVRFTMIEDESEDRPCMLTRDISHAKLICGQAVEPQAKAYLGVTPRWFP